MIASESRTRILLRRARRLLVAALILSVATLAGAPWLAGTRPGRALVVAVANRALAPTSIELESLQLSWTDSTKLSGIVLRDGKGKAIVASPSGSHDRSVWQLLTARPDYGTLTLAGAKVDLAREANGSIDLMKALGPLLASDPSKPSNPNTEFALKVIGGTLNLSTPELSAPLKAEQLDMTLSVPKAPAPLTWDIALTNRRAGAEALSIKGSYDQRSAAGSNPDLTLSVAGTRWPLAVAAKGLGGTGRFDGTAELACDRGQWKTHGLARVLELDASGGALKGDRLLVERAEMSWEINQSEGRWLVRRMELKSPVASLSALGEWKDPADASAKVEGQIDLAALAKQLPKALHLRPGLVLERGAVRFTANIRDRDGRQAVDLIMKVSDLHARAEDRPIVLQAPATLSALVSRSADGVAVERVGLQSDACDLTATGDLEKGVTLTGTVELAKLTSQAGAIVDLGGHELAGRAAVAGTYARTDAGFNARLAADVRDLVVVRPGADPLRTNLARVSADAKGAVDASGLPSGWSEATASVRSRELSVDGSARRGECRTDLKVGLAAAFEHAGHPGRLEATLRGNKAGDIFLIDRLRALVRPTNPAEKAATVAVSATVAFDAARGTIAVRPLAGTQADTVTPTGEGLTISGINHAEEALQVEGTLALAVGPIDRALAYWTGTGAREVHGKLAAGLTARRDLSGAIAYAVRLESSDLAYAGSRPEAPQKIGGLVSLSSKGMYRLEPGRLELANLTISTPYGSAKAAGTIDDLAGRRLADLGGSISPDAGTIDAIAARAIEPGAKLRIEPRTLRIKGSLAGDNAAAILAGLDAEIGLDIVSAKAFGVQIGRAPLIVRANGGGVSVDPITTTINGGTLGVKPLVTLESDGGVTLAFAPGSIIDGAEINDEISTRLLSYIAPILHEATRVHGKLSLALDQSSFPIVAAGGRTTNVSGTVTFQDVVYGPGPLATQVLGLIGEARVPSLRLDQDVKFRVADGRVGQEGLKIPLKAEVEIALDGSVGFDKSIALKAGVPITPAMLGDNRHLLGQLVDGTRLGVPIGGTLSRPVLDRRAAQAGLKDLVGSMARRGAAAGAQELLKKVDREGAAGSLLRSLGGGSAGDPAEGEGAPEADGSASPAGRIAQDAFRLLRRPASKPRSTPR